MIQNIVMKYKVFLWHLLILLSLPVQASVSQDSTRIESMLLLGASLPADSCRMLFYGKAFLNTPYEAGTLEEPGEEKLIVRLDSMDCTTFVETILAFALTERQGILTYRAFIHNLTQIRYRKGVIQGYSSRLHYFSDWVKENEAKGFVHERSQELSSIFRPLHLSFMTNHIDAYPALKSSKKEIEKMQEIESQWQHKEMYYIPKQKLNQPADKLNIYNGDILALTTSINGLDVVHMGIACWIKGQLHLLHASSVKGKVILDSTPLYDYLKNKNAHTGIRVVSVCAPFKE